MRGKLSWGAAVILGCLAVSAALGSTVIGLSIEDQARLSKWIVVGEVQSLQGVDHPVNGLETAVSLKVSDVFKGPAKAGQTIVFYTRGGEANGVISEAVGEAVFRPGQRTLVFIEETDGRAYNLGLSMGVWNVLEPTSGRPSFSRAVQDGLEVVGTTPIESGPLSWSDMASRVGWTMTHPDFDESLLRDAAARRR
jgi:hypothetical protein